jgi:hypothetical protein
MVDLDGVLVPCVTPFGDDGSLDLDAYAQVVRFVLDAGVRGVIPGGTTGEYYAMSVDERVAVLRHTIEVVERRGRRPPGRHHDDRGVQRGFDPRRAHARERTAAELGYDAVMLAVPPTSLPTQDELVAHYTTVAEGGRAPRRALRLPGPCRRPDRPRGDRPARRPARHRRHQGVERRPLAVPRPAPLVAGRMTICCGADDLAVDFFGVGRAQLDRRHRERAPAPPRRRARRRDPRRPRRPPAGCSTASCPGSRTARPAATTRRRSSASTHQGVRGRRGPRAAAAARRAGGHLAHHLALLDAALAVAVR